MGTCQISMSVDNVSILVIYMHPFLKETDSEKNQMFVDFLKTYLYFKFPFNENIFSLCHKS